MKYLLLASLAALLCTAGFANAQVGDDSIFSGVSYNDDVSRKVNLDAAGVVEVQTGIQFKPLKSGEPYYYIIPQGLEEHLVDIKAVISSTQASAKVASTTPSKLPADLQNTLNQKNVTDIVIFKIDIKTGDQSGKGVVGITINELYKRRKEPFPAKIAIREEMSLRYVDSKHYISLYPTKTQKFQINYNTNAVLFYTPDSTADKKGRSLKYGPFKNIEALSFSDFMIHYRYNKPMAIFTEVKKTIEVSHWGNINVDEYYEMHNEAAGIKGEFGRVDYQSWDHSRAQYAIKGLSTSLPRYIRGLYYWDYIGNISSSSAFRDDDKVNFKIEPRFPVMGQWKVDWSQGYNMPTRYHLFQDNKSGRYFFNYTFDHDLSDILAENYTLKIILPEGATNVKVHIPFEVDSMETSPYFSTLDYIGKTLITIKKNNVHSQLHKQPFQVSYDFSDQAMFIEPMYVIVFFFACYLAAIFYARIDLSFKDDKQKKLN